MRASVFVMLRKWLVVLAVAFVAVGLPSMAGAAEAVWVKASRIADKDIDESSSLAVSRRFTGVAYTANDESDPVIYAIDIPSGKLVGKTRLTGTRLRDPEAMALDRRGRLWLADTGDNKESRRDAALYMFPEQGPANARVAAVRYPIAYSDGQPHNVETLLVSPATGAKFLVTKAKKGSGAVFALPQPLHPDTTNVATALGVDVPRNVSDGAISPNGAWAVLRDDEDVHVFRLRSLSKVQTVAAPPVDKGESVAFNPSGRSVLMGSEGKKSPLFWIGFDQAAGRVPTR